MVKHENKAGDFADLVSQLFSDERSQNKLVIYTVLLLPHTKVALIEKHCLEYAANFRHSKYTSGLLAVAARLV